MKAVIISFFITLSTLTSHAQQRDIVLTGTVTDHQNEPLPGATIRIKGTQFGTVTDTDGHYLLRGKWKENDLILFSFIGMKEIRVKYTGQKVQDAAMQEDPKALDEVIIVARQNINELDIRAKSGVVQRVDVERLNSKPMIDMSLALQGTVPGLIITNTGDLGSKPEIRIRGNSSFRKGDMANEPLYVMDGKVISSDAFMTLNPADIQEIKVLKDAVACALYGIKAANGVIEITSQRGNPDSTETVSIQAPYTDFSTAYTVEGSENSAKIKELTLKQVRLQKDVDALVKAAQAHQLGNDVFEDSLAVLLKNYKDDVKINYIFAAPNTASAYFALFQKLNNYGYLLFCTFKYTAWSVSI